MKSIVKGAFLATAVAGLFFAGGSALADHHEKGKKSGETVKCEGVNECAGKGACGGDAHSCAGKNECKGKGWIKLSKAECEEKGGTIKGDEKKKKG